MSYPEPKRQRKAPAASFAYPVNVKRDAYSDISGAERQMHHEDNRRGGRSIGNTAIGGEAAVDEYDPISLVAANGGTHAEYDKNCFCCVHGFGGTTIDHPYMKELNKIFREQKSKIADSEVFYLLSEYHEENYVNKLGFPLCSKEQFEHHVNHHMYDYDLEVKVDIKLLKTLVEVTSKHVLKKHQVTGEITVNKDMVDAFLKAMDRKEALMVRINKERILG
jgi:hypothetical protein